MNHPPKFYSVIIGSELLNGRRRDAHFEFLNGELLSRGLEHAGSFLIADSPQLMREVLEMIAKESRSVMFCFGGIGATPDDYTRQVAAVALGDGKLYRHPEASKRIIERFKERAYPNRITMADLPKEANIIENPINQVPGFELKQRFFFLPGFPEMAHPMIRQMLDLHYPSGIKKHRRTLKIITSEESLIEFMRELPESIDLSSLPESHQGGPSVTLSLAGFDPDEVEAWFARLLGLLQAHAWEYTETEHQLHPL